MKTREIEIDGQKLEIKAWTVRDRRNFLEQLERIKILAPREQFDEIVRFLAEQTGKDIQEIEQLDSIIADKLLDAIIRANTAPLAPQRT